SPVSRIFEAVSLKLSSSLRSKPMLTMGGFDPITLKKLNGAALITPASERELIQAMGRGVTVAVNILYRLASGKARISNCMKSPYRSEDVGNPGRLVVTTADCGEVFTLSRKTSGRA